MIFSLNPCSPFPGLLNPAPRIFKPIKLTYSQPLFITDGNTHPNGPTHLSS